MENNSQIPDKIRGCLIGGAAGDALGYEIEFTKEDGIFARYGAGGIQAYALNAATGKAVISDDTQMTLFTANGILVADTCTALRGIDTAPRTFMLQAYQDWLRTQQITFAQSREEQRARVSWLCDVPELYHCRAPGVTCMSALSSRQVGEDLDYIRRPLNNSKGCGGVMRVAPMGLKRYPYAGIKTIDLEGAQLAAITHSHSLGYIPAAVLTHIISRCVYPETPMTLLQIVQEARDTVAELFAGDAHIQEMTDLIDRAIDLSQNTQNDLPNIHQLGAGWVGEEALAIAVYCALRYENDFSAGIIAAVNHSGDSDSTGAVTGNILGARLGLGAIDEKWKTNLELYDVLLEIADDLYNGCRMRAPGDFEDPAWRRKYCDMRWKV